MTASYWWRLAWLGLACFFLVHSMAGVAISLLAQRAVRIAGRLRPRAAARLMLTLRLLPLACSIAAVAGLCLPSYLWFEPAATREQVGWMCLIAALLGVATLATSIGRAVHATLRSTNVPFGPLGKILAETEMGTVGQRVSSFWPSSGTVTAITFDLRTPAGTVHKVPLRSTTESSDRQRSHFLTAHSRKLLSQKVLGII